MGSGSITQEQGTIMQAGDEGCTLTTTFRGTLRGDVIEGTFRSEGSEFHHLPQSGRWRVKRSAR